MHIIFYDIEDIRQQLLPITFTRPTSMLQIGFHTIMSRWHALLPHTDSHSFITAPYLAEKFPAPTQDTLSSPDTITISSHYIPTPELADAIAALRPGEAVVDPTADNPEIAVIARRGPANPVKIIPFSDAKPISITRLYHLFELAGQNIDIDFRILTQGRQSQPLSPSCTLVGPSDRLFIERGAYVEGAIINVASGPVYIARDATVMEGSSLRGPIVVGNHAQINMGARIYGPTIISTGCKVGGELNNVVMHPYSNKAHDGFLGNAVIGSWCNIGAGATASNLKNDYSEIKLWDYPSHRFLRTGLQFCGLIMADHSKAGINTMFNTATVLGVAVNVYGTGFPRNFIPSFTEGSPSAGFSDLSLQRFRTIATRVMARRGIPFTDADMKIFEAIHIIADDYK